MHPEFKAHIQGYLLEDVKDGDHTSLATIPNNATGSAKMYIKSDGILAGVEAALGIFNEVNSQLQVEVYLQDGAAVKKGDIALKVHGNLQAILVAERLVLNVMQRMSGIATMTHKFVQATAGTKATILDTRKTTPGFRLFEKWAVRIGGGTNHRIGLYDTILIKDNHQDFAGGLAKAITAAHNYLEQKNMQLPIVVEVRNMDELQIVLDGKAVTRVMLDNFSPAEIKKAVAHVNGRLPLEASGGINLTTVAEYAQTGVDYLSVGAVTHSYKSMDISLKAVRD